MSLTMKYKVEAFIFPSINAQLEKVLELDANEIDDVKAANNNKLRFSENFTTESFGENDQCNSSFEEAIYAEILENSLEKNWPEPIYDEPFIGNLQLPNQKNHAYSKLQFRKYGSYESLPKPPIRSSSLKVIHEASEASEEDYLDEFCYHGYKNGCTANVQSPKEISREVFQDHWLQKLESLRQKEALLKDKEINLQSRERLLFKKEKELRILERLIKEKMNRAELYLKRCRNSQSLDLSIDCESTDRNSDSRSSNGTKKDVKIEAPKHKNNGAISSNKVDKPKTLNSNIKEEVFKNPPNSRSSSSSKITRNISTYSSFHGRIRPKVTYDDLDSTLSADIGDGSFVVTAKKFDPEVFKKPLAFTRSASERRKSPIETPDFEEERVLKKISDNILVSRDKATKFQHYGLIDDNKPGGMDKRCSYLNLETGKKQSSREKISKPRPTSWNEDANEWLLKKRQAYNLATKEIPQEMLESVENLGGNGKMKKCSKPKKENKSKMKFTIFR